MKAEPRIVAVLLLCGICLGRAAGLLDSWAERYVGTMVRDVAYGGGLFVAAGDAFYDSLDGVCWRRRALDTPSINGIWGGGLRQWPVCGGGVWAARRESRVYTSAGGTAWQQS